MLYRAGEPGRALETFRESTKVFDPLAWDHLFLAMTHHRLGHPEEARRHLTEATGWIDREDQKHDHGVWPEWWYWVECHRLRPWLQDILRLVSASMAEELNTISQRKAFISVSDELRARLRREAEDLIRGRTPASKP